jgi:hypothetical protein
MYLSIRDMNKIQPLVHLFSSGGPMKIQLTLATGSSDGKSEFTPVEAGTIKAVVIGVLSLAEFGDKAKRDLLSTLITDVVSSAITAAQENGANDVRSLCFHAYRAIEATKFEVTKEDNNRVETALDSANWPKIRQVAALNGRFRTAAKETGLLTVEQLDVAFPSWAAKGKKVIRR